MEINEKISSSTSFTKTGDFINGTLSGSIMVLALQPLSTLKTYFMDGRGIPPASKLYKGTITNMLSVAPIQGLAFSAQSLLVTHYFKDPKSITDRQKMAVGLFAGVATSLLTTAFERVMIQQQLHGSRHAKAINTIVKQAGLPGLFKGGAPTSIRELLFFCALFGTTDIFAKRLKEQLPTEWSHGEVFSKAVASFTSGALAGGLSTPADVIKTRMQGDLGNQYPTSCKTLSLLIKTEGVKSLIHGIWIRSGYVGLAILILACAKDKLPQYFPKSFYQ